MEGATVHLMHMSTALQEELHPHVSADVSPPDAVYAVVNSLVDTTKIVASVSEFVRDEPTIWRVWALTQTTLTFVEVRFDELSYDRDRSLEDYYRQRPPLRKILTAWTRPLSTVAALFADEVGEVRGEARWYPATLVLLFVDGLKVQLPREESLHRAPDRERTDAFLKALRDALA
ncbi:hypothetical protein ACFWAY_44325 [Rhodococcus sp. NPDC059968]|uniref:hypothetical protein n=1 Tax=Rhodococcus sp. NPDC059968 TaxID=3347017 RepID=UPI003672ED10